MHIVCVSATALSAGDLRLAPDGPSGALDGRLEIFLNGTWGIVCADGLDLYEADIACRQLGFLYADRVGTASQLR